MTKEIIIGKGTTNEITVYTTKVEEVRGNQFLIDFTAPQGSASWGGGPKDHLIVDGQRITVKFNIDGFIDATNRTKLKNIFNGGGVFTMEYAGTDYTGAMEKIMITETSSDSGTTKTVVDCDTNLLPDYYDVKFTFVEGVNYGSS